MSERVLVNGYEWWCGGGEFDECSCVVVFNENAILPDVTLRVRKDYDNPDRYVAFVMAVAGNLLHQYHKEYPHTRDSGMHAMVDWWERNGDALIDHMQQHPNTPLT